MQNQPRQSFSPPMNSRRFLSVLFFVALSWWIPVQARAADEKERIEGLISRIENLKDAKFIRNGSSYDSKNAAKFLRAKWQAKDAEIKTADDFIDKVATFSSTTGRPYIIHFSTGREVKCGEYLKAELKK